MDATNAIQIVSPMVQKQEGFSSSAYWDVNGYAIGFGNHYWSDGTTIDAGSTISLSDAVDLLNFTLQQTFNEISPCITATLTDNQLAALLDLAYNWGAGNVCNSVLLQLINSGASSADIDAQWAKTATTSGGVNNSTLYNRRLSEDSLFDTVVASVQDAVAAVPTWGWYVGGGLAAAMMLYFLLKKPTK